MNTSTILMTGGHPTPAIACIDYIKENDKNVKIVFLGRRYINRLEKNDTLEYQEVAIRRCMPFIDSSAQRGLLGVAHLHSSVSQSLNVMSEYKPDLVLAFGGYISVPACIAAAIRGIPYYIHEQTSKPGLANRVLGLHAKKVFVSFESTINDFFSLPWTEHKVSCTGNPLRNELFEKHPKPASLENATGPTLFVNGGNMGSHAINNHIFNIAPELLLNMNIVHQVGNIDEFGDWEVAKRIQENCLSDNLKHKYMPFRHLGSTEMAAFLQHSDLVVCRSGANTFFELILFEKPAIVIPLPYSARDEQEEQASILSDSGVVEIFDQNQKSDILYKRIMVVLNSLITHKKSYAKLEKFKKFDAAKSIWENIQKSQT